jgi:hypothetical protein
MPSGDEIAQPLGRIGVDFVVEIHARSQLARYTKDKANMPNCPACQVSQSHAGWAAMPKMQAHRRRRSVLDWDR